MTVMKNSHQLKPLNVLVIGDTCTDEYQYGTVDRINPEAPVPVVSYKYSQSQDGMAGNVAANLKALGCNVIRQTKHAGIKTRIIDLKSKQHIARIDHDTVSTPIEPIFMSDIDAVVVSDYNKGAVSYETITQALALYPLVIVDTKKTDLAQLEGCVVKINEPEYNRLKTECSDLIVTRGDRPVTFKGNAYPVPAQDPVDVCGAGDTFLSAFAYKFALTNNFDTAIDFAIRASCVTIDHVGVYAPTLEEINESC
jgi:bifunctional ADP-heptose synthase (sugar kinase/adenylyltransferase)